MIWGGSSSNEFVASAVWYKTQPHNCTHGVLVLCLVADIRWLDSPNVSKVILMAIDETDRYLTKTLFQLSANCNGSFFCLNGRTILWIWIIALHTRRPRQNGHHFPDDIFKRISSNENVRIVIRISLKFVLKGTINNISVVQIIAHQASSNYLNQWWLIYWRIYASLGLNELIYPLKYRGVGCFVLLFYLDEPRWR